MMLVEQAGVPLGALPIQELKDHLRLGSGFSDADVQDTLVESYLRAAMAAIEGRIGKALILRRFEWVVTGWSGGIAGQALPIAPVAAVVEVAVIDAEAAVSVVEAGRYNLRPDLHRPRLAPKGTGLPTIPDGGRARIVFDAGFGAAWADVPADLRQAVLLLAAHYHEFRHELDIRQSAPPFGVAGLLERWRNIRVLGGGGR